MLSNIKNFSCRKDFISFMKQNAYKLVGYGSEGKCYLGREKKVYKCMYPSKYSPYNIGEIITTKDVQIPSFVFPEELYAVDDLLNGYRTEYVKRDLFRVENVVDLESIADLDFETLASAYKEMLRDMKELSKQHIQVFDFMFNIMYDGEKIKAIDTCGYKRVSNDPGAEYSRYEGNDPTDFNIECLNSAIEAIFGMWVSRAEDIRIEGNDIDGYLGEVFSVLPSDIKMQKVKRMLEQDVHGRKGK